jgi:hypothetical protein
MIGLGLVNCQAAIPDPVRRSYRALKFGIAFSILLCALVSARGFAQNAGSVIKYGNREWKPLKQVTGAFGPGASFDIRLLESVDQTGGSGNGGPMDDVQIVIQEGGGVVYEFKKSAIARPRDAASGSYMDDELEIKDVPNDGIPELLFHSGFQGASDHQTFEHVLRYEKAHRSFTDVAPASFYNSGTHGLRWLEMGRRTLAVIADRNWSPTVAVEYRCHICASPFQYNIYQWSDKTTSFVRIQHLHGQKSYDEAGEALNGDWALIQGGIKR